MPKLDISTELKYQKRADAMTGTKTARHIQWLSNAIALRILFFGFYVAQASDFKNAYKDEKGLKLQVNDDDN